MNLIIPTEKFDKKYIIYSDNMENKFISNSKFVKIFYSTPYFSLQSLFITFELENVYFEDFFDKKKCFFNKSKNIKTIKQLTNIEYKILENFNDFHNLNLNLCKLLDNSYFKLSNKKKNTKNHDKNRFVVRISGIWFQNNDCGLIFKFFII